MRAALADDAAKANANATTKGERTGFIVFLGRCRTGGVRGRSMCPRTQLTQVIGRVKKATRLVGNSNYLDCHGRTMQTQSLLTFRVKGARHSSMSPLARVRLLLL